MMESSSGAPVDEGFQAGPHTHMGEEMKPMSGFFHGYHCSHGASFCFAFVPLFSVFSISPCKFVILISFASYFSVT